MEEKSHFLGDNSLLAMYELSIYVFTHISKNVLILADVKKILFYEALNKESGLARITFVMDFLYQRLEEEYEGEGMVFFDSRNNVQDKAKNIFYVYKLLETVKSKN